MANKLDEDIVKDQGADDTMGALKNINSLLASGETGAKDGTTHLRVECSAVSIPRYVDGGTDSDVVLRGEVHPLETFGNSERVATLIGRGYVSEVVGQ